MRFELVPVGMIIVTIFLFLQDKTSQCGGAGAVI